MRAIGTSLKVFFGLLFVLASIVYSQVHWAGPQPKDDKPPEPSGLQLVTQQRSCDAGEVRLLTEYPHDKGTCVPAADAPEGPLRDAVNDMSTSCPTGTAVVSVEDGEVLGWCNTTQEGNT